LQIEIDHGRTCLFHPIQDAVRADKTGSARNQYGVFHCRSLTSRCPASSSGRHRNEFPPRPRLEAPPAPSVYRFVRQKSAEVACIEQFEARADGRQDLCAIRLLPSCIVGRRPPSGKGRPGRHSCVWLPKSLNPDKLMAIARRNTPLVAFSLSFAARLCHT
jgi:hypothetical protein